jgi:hypothetical protein
MQKRGITAALHPRIDLSNHRHIRKHRLKIVLRYNSRMKAVSGASAGCAATLHAHTHLPPPEYSWDAL